MATAYKLVNYDYTSMVGRKSSDFVLAYRFNVPTDAPADTLGLFCYTHKQLAIRVARILSESGNMRVKVLEVEGHERKPNPGLVANIGLLPLPDYYQRARAEPKPQFQEYELVPFGEDWQLFQTVIPLWEIEYK